MQGNHCFKPKGLIYVDVDELIPSNHILRKIDQQVSFDFIKELTRDYYCSNNGRPSIDPEIFFRLLLISYLYGISSDRQLCEEVQYNLAYRWFCKLSLQDEVPEHSSLTRIRDRLGVKIFKSFFDEILEQCRKKGLVKGERIMTDSTLIEANASLDSLVRYDQKSLNQKPSNDHKIQQFSFSKDKKISNATHRSTSDPDATLAFKVGKVRRLKYKAHLSIDADSRIVVSIPVTTGAYHDSKGYLENLKTLKESYGLKINEAIADRAYGSGQMIQSVTDQGIVPYIPLYSGKSGSTLEEAKNFLFEEKANRYRCPVGIYLLPYSKVSKDRRVMYRSRSKECRNCQQETSCLAERMPHSHMRYIRRHIHQDVFEKTIQRMKTTRFKNRLLERFWKIEGIISEAKHRQGLGKARYRGLIKTQIQAYLSASVLNIKRLVQAFLLFVFYTMIEEAFINQV